MAVKGFEATAVHDSLTALLSTDGVFVDDHEVIIRNLGPANIAVGSSGSAYHVVLAGEELRFRSVTATQMSCKAYQGFGGNHTNALVTALVIGELV
jgi:hypothetical protein